MMSDRTCESCGMGMTNDEDFPGGNRASRYCVHCGDADGNLTAKYEDLLAWYTDDWVKSKGLDARTARAEAVAYLASLPAWSGRPPLGDVRDTRAKAR